MTRPPFRGAALYANSSAKMEIVTGLTSALTLVVLAMQEIRVGVPGARATLIRTVQETVAAQGVMIALLRSEVDDLKEQLNART